MKSVKMDLNSDEKIKKRNLKVYSILGTIILIGGAISFLVKESEFKGEKRYTIATIYDKDYLTGGITYSRYWYKVSNKTYYGQIKDGTLKIDQRYIVAFSKKIPKSSRLMDRIQVKGNLQSPDTGWSKIPDELIIK